jgi:hypothetical protein
MLLMPLGMTPGAAAPAHQAMSGEMPMGHCPDQGSGHDDKRGLADCTMACAAALPPAVAHTDEPLLSPGSRLEPALAQRLHGLHPDTATPPPRAA